MIKFLFFLCVAGLLLSLAWLWFEIYKLGKEARTVRKKDRLSFTAYRGPKLTQEQEKELFDQINTLRRDIGGGYDQ